MRCCCDTCNTRSTCTTGWCRCREIYTELLQRHAEGARGDGLEWLQMLSDAAAARTQELIGDPEGKNLAHPDRFLEENLRDIESRNQRDRLAEIDRDLRRAEGARQEELLREKRELRKAMESAGIVLRTNPARRLDRDAEGV